MPVRPRLLALVLALSVLAPVLNAPGASSAAPGVKVPTVQLDAGPGGYMSRNLSYVATIPLDSPGVGAKLLTVGAQKRLYVTGISGASIYDVTNPGIPLLLGHLPLPNWENESVSVSRDGNTMLISGDEQIGLHWLYVIDTTIVNAPHPVARLAVGGGHTVTCMDDPCNWVYGSRGDIIDLRVKAAPKLRPEKWTRMLGLGFAHNIERDEAGIFWSDTSTIAAIDARNPLKPVRLGSGRAPAGSKTALQHNNLRPRAREYKPRPGPAAGLDDFDVPPPTDALRPGELLYSTGETSLGAAYDAAKCNDGSGPFATYRVDGFERGGGGKIRLLDIFRPVNGRLDEGDAVVNALGCSSHWFTYNPSDTSIVAVGWYEHGTRLFKVNQKTGKIGQIGYFQPAAGSASAAYWVDDHYIYVVDYARGIDILKYNAGGLLPSDAEFEASWLAKAGVKDAVSSAERLSCRLSVA